MSIVSPDLRQAFNFASIGMALVGLDGQFLQVNAAYCRLTGYDETELVARTFQDITHPDDLALDLAQAERLAQGEIEGYEMEKRYIRKDGALIWVLLTGSAVRDPEGRPVHFIAQIQDITARKAAEAALQQERDLLQTILDALPDAVYVKDVDSRFVRLNSATARVLGADDPGFVLGRSDADFFPEDLAARFRADEEFVIRTGVPLLNQLEPQAEGDAATWSLTSTVPLTDDGAVVGVIGINRDVTEVQHVQQRLAESEVRYRTLVEQLPVVIAIKAAGSGSATRYVSPQIGEVLGYSPQEYMEIGDAWISMIHPEDLPDVRAAEARSDATGQRFQAEYRCRAKDGRWVWLRDDGVLIRPTDGGDPYWQTVLIDITDQKRVEAELRKARKEAEQANRAKSHFLSTMSHELRTPLNAILGYADFLLHPAADPVTERQREEIETIASSGERLLRLINDILDITRIESGEIVLERLPVELPSVLAAALEEITPEAREKGLEVILDVPRALPVVEADPGRLQQVLANLLGNAVKFTDEGAIMLRASPGEDGAVIEVRDSGIGIAADDLPHIFEPFRQVDAGMSRRFGGTGLGLAVSCGLVRLHGGTIAVESEPGKGSAFIVALPTR
jgi:PAS domain S-box-containing protein